MIGQVQKPMEEILEMLDGKEKLILYGFCGCATVRGVQRLCSPEQGMSE